MRVKVGLCGFKNRNHPEFVKVVDALVNNNIITRNGDTISFYNTQFGLFHMLMTLDEEL